MPRVPRQHYRRVSWRNRAKCFPGESGALYDAFSSMTRSNLLVVSNAAKSVKQPIAGDRGQELRQRIRTHFAS